MTTSKSYFIAEVPDDGNAPEIDFNSQTWKNIRTKLLSFIQAARENNDSLHLNEQKTAIIRGRIRAYKDLLELETTAPGTPHQSYKPPVMPVME